MRTLRILLILLLVVPGAALAQDDPVLPDLTPREVEIRGELTIRFPSLRRQPLVGFNPPPRIPDVPAGRQPFTDEYKLDREDLPISPLAAPTSPPVSPYLYGPSFQGRVEAGLGRYSERFVFADIGSKPDSRTVWTAVGSYRGRGGFEPYPDMKAAYDQGKAALEISLPAGGAVLTGSMKGEASRYDMYGAEPAMLAASLPGPGREVRGGTVSARLERPRGSLRYHLAGALSVSDIRTNAFDPEIRTDPRTEQEDGTVEIDGGFELPGASMSGWGLGSWSGTVLGSGVVGSTDASGYTLGGGVRFDLGSAGRLTLGLVALGGRADSAATRIEERDHAHVSARLRFDGALAPNIRVYIDQNPHVDRVRLLDLYQEQPFIVDSPVLEPEVWPIDVTGRGIASFGDIELSAEAGYRTSPNRRFFEHDPTTFLEYGSGISTVSHGRARETHGGFDVTGWLSPSIQVSAGGTVRSGRLTDLEENIPYFSSWTLRSLVSLGFSGGRGLVQVATRVEGPRKRDLSGSRELPAFADMDFLASWRLTDAASAVFRIENIGGNRPEWDRYLRPPTIVTAGLSWDW